MTAARKTFCAILVILLAFPFLETGPAAAAGPNCIAVENTTSDTMNFTVVGWDQYTWTWRPNETLTYVSFNGIDIKSQAPDGGFTVKGVSGTTINQANTTWTFRQDLTGGQGQVGTCGATWVLTIHYPGVTPSPAPSPAPAPGPAPGTMNYDHPGSCLYVKNTTNVTVTIKVTHPTGYENVHWDYAAGEFALVASGGVAIKSPDGGWYLTWQNYSGQGTWTYDPSITQDNCNGEWVFTM